MRDPNANRGFTSAFQFTSGCMKIEKRGASRLFPFFPVFSAGTPAVKIITCCSSSSALAPRSIQYINFHRTSTHSNPYLFRINV
jgi:hypothetical protein